MTKDEQTLKPVLPRISPGFMAQPEEVAQAIQCWASDAVSCVTGTTTAGGGLLSGGGL